MAGFVLLSWSFLCSDMDADPLLADLFYDHRYSHTRMTNPDFVLLAKAMGVHAIRVSSVSELPEKMKEFLEYDGNRPVLLECMVETNEHVFPMVCPPRPISSLVY
jgi:thiamine pyrophosphate-dependent acetolactate synthase large subunit-like protein